MPTTVTDSEPAEGVSHHDAASKFFDAPADKPLDKPADKSPAPAPDKTPDKAADKPVVKSALDSIIKLPGSQDAGDKKPADQKPADDPIAGLKDPDEKSKHFADWKALKAAATERGAKLAQLEKEAAELRAKVEASSKQAPVDDATKARLAELEEANKRYSDRLKQLDLRSHPDFEKEFIAPRKASVEALKKILAEEEIPGVDVDALLANRGKKLNEQVSGILDKLTPFSQGAFSAKIREVLTIDERAAEATSKADEYLKTHQHQHLSRSREVFDQVSREFNGLFATIQVDEKATPEAKQAADTYNAALVQVGRQAEQLAFGQVDDVAASRMANESANFRFLISHGLPRIGEILNTQAAEVARLTEELNSIKAAKPGVSGGFGKGGEDKPAETQADHFAAAQSFFRQ